MPMIGWSVMLTAMAYSAADQPRAAEQRPACLERHEVQVTPISSALGVEVSKPGGFPLNLTEAWSDQLFEQLDSLLLRHKLLLFRGQVLSPDMQINITRRWGAVITHPLGSRVSAKKPGIPAELIVLENTMKPRQDTKELKCGRRAFHDGEARNDM